MRYGLEREILLKPGFRENQPLKIPLGHSARCALSLAPCSSLKPPNDTTPGGTQSSHDIVSRVRGLAFVLLELEKSGAPLPRSFILCTAAV